MCLLEEGGGFSRKILIKKGEKKWGGGAGWNEVHFIDPRNKFKNYKKHPQVGRNNFYKFK